MAVGLTVRGELAAHAPAKIVRGDLHSPGRAAVEQVDVDVEEKGANSDDGHDRLLLEQVSLLAAETLIGQLELDVRSPASDRIRVGHGARGPPRT